jgi:hypothetical protein
MANLTSTLVQFEFASNCAHVQIVACSMESDLIRYPLPYDAFYFPLDNTWPYPINWESTPLVKMQAIQTKVVAFLQVKKYP